MAGKLDVVIWGAGALGEQVQYIFSYQLEVRVRAFLDNDPTRVGTQFHGVQVREPTEECLRQMHREGVTHGIVAIGNGRLREKFSIRLEEAGYQIASAVHPTAHISPQVRLGKGLIILACVNLFHNPVIGNYVFMANNTVVSHDNVIEDNVALSTGSIIGARIHVGKNVFVGVGASVVHKDTGSIEIGEDAIIGAGAVVLEDVPARAVVVGVPARVVRYRTLDSRGNLA